MLCITATHNFVAHSGEKLEKLKEVVVEKTFILAEKERRQKRAGSKPITRGLFFLGQPKGGKKRCLQKKCQSMG